MPNIRIGFKLSKNQKRVLINALDFCKAFSELRWSDAFELLYPNGFIRYDGRSVFRQDWRSKMESFQENLFHKSQLNVKELNMSDSKHVATIQQKLESTGLEFILGLSAEELRVFMQVLDFPYRVVAGQWDTFGQWLNQIYDAEGSPIYESWWCNEPFVDVYRNDIIAVYDNKGLSPGASFGVMSSELSEDTRVLYDLYEVFMHEYSGVGVHSYKPRKAENTNDKMPIVEFDVDYLFEFTNEIANPAQTDALVNQKFSVNSKSLRKFEGYDNELFAPCAEDIGTLYQMLTLGDKVFLKKNGFFYISHSEDPEPTIEYRLNIKS